MSTMEILCYQLKLKPNQKSRKLLLNSFTIRRTIYIHSFVFMYFSCPHLAHMLPYILSKLVGKQSATPCAVSHQEFSNDKSPAVPAVTCPCRINCSQAGICC